MAASPVSGRRQSLEDFVHEPGRDCAVDLCNCNCDCIFGKDFYTSGNFAYYLLNSVFMLFVAIALAYLMGTIAPNRDALTGIANIISLGMCFLGGAFVPLEFMGNDVKAVSQFLPVYWYEKANDILADFGHLTASAKGQFLQAIMIQLVFTAVFVCLVLVVEKYKRVDS